LSTNAPFISLDPQRTLSIGSLWRRTLAFVVDGLILYAVGRIVGSAFFDKLSHLGPLALLLGFCLALAYFAILDSGIGSGQTLGKRLLRLKVVNAQGSLIKWERSAARYTFFALPYFLIGLRFPIESTPWIIPFLISFIAFGIGGSTLYLLVFNRRTGQGLHDVTMGTYVVESGASGPLTTEQIWGMHWWAISSFLLLLTLTALSKGVSINWHQKSGHVYQDEEDARLIEKLGGVQTSEVRVLGSNRSDRGAILNLLPKKKRAIVTVQWTGEAGDRQSIADQAARIILQNDPRVEKQDLIRIEVGRVYDLGIASGNDYQTFTHTYAEWSQRVLGASPAQSPTPTHQ
jgi:uncharacterized RDD family membrane protein YckC